MSISNVTHSSPIGLGNILSRTQNTPASRPGDFAAILRNAGGVEQIQGVNPQPVQAVGARGVSAASASDVDRANSALFGNNGAHFAQLLARAAETTVSSSQVITSSSAAGATAPAGQTVSTSAVRATDALMRAEAGAGSAAAPAAFQGDNIAAQAAQIVGALDSVKIMEGQKAMTIAALEANSVVDLQDKTLDFSTMLPQGMRSFLSDLNCGKGELNNFVNEMIFGSNNGPHGQNAADYFGTSSLTGSQLTERMNGLLNAAKINSADFNAQDYNFVLRNESNSLGNTIAVANGADLQERSIEREVNSTFQSDMALMQVLSHTNNQSATIF